VIDQLGVLRPFHVLNRRTIESTSPSMPFGPLSPSSRRSSIGPYYNAQRSRHSLWQDYARRSNRTSMPTETLPDEIVTFLTSIRNSNRAIGARHEKIDATCSAFRMPERSNGCSSTMSSGCVASPSPSPHRFRPTQGKLDASTGRRSKNWVHPLAIFDPVDLCAASVDLSLTPDNAYHNPS